MSKIRKQLKDIVHGEQKLKENLEHLGLRDLARESKLGDDLFIKPLSRYVLLERCLLAILASQNALKLDPMMGAEFAGRRALAMLRWLDEHEAEVDEAVAEPVE